MNNKRVVMTAMIVGTSIGSSIPLLWGDSFLSVWSVVLTAVGGFVGIYVGYLLTR